MKTQFETPKILIHDFAGIPPINTLAEGRRVGNFFGAHGHCNPVLLDDECPRFIPEGLAPRDISLVCFGAHLGQLEYVDRLATLGMKPCVCAPTYLFGLMALFPEDRMPREFKEIDIVAAEPNPRSITPYSKVNLKDCFYYACRGGTGRVLNLLTVEGRWSPRTAFMAQRIAA